MKNKVKVKLTKELVAPCGMNCAFCTSYLAMIYNVRAKGAMMTYCTGCRPRGKMCAFIKKRCALLLANKVQFCFECKKFPCANLQHLDEKYKRDYHTSFIENLKTIKTVGINKFLRAQHKKQRCPRCGGVLSVHNDKCYDCDIDWLIKRYKIKRKTPIKKR